MSTTNGGVWTNSKTIRLLKTLRKTTRSASSPITTASLHRITISLGSKFSHTQIKDKLRKLKEKYHKHGKTKCLIKTSLDRKIYKISRRIWGSKPKPGKNEKTPLISLPLPLSPPSVKEVEVEERSEVCLDDFPVLVSEFARFFPGKDVWKEGLKCLKREQLKEMNEKWMLLRIEEARVLGKKGEFVQEQARLLLEAAMKDES